MIKYYMRRKTLKKLRDASPADVFHVLTELAVTLYHNFKSLSPKRGEAPLPSVDPTLWNGRRDKKSDP